MEKSLIPAPKPQPAKKGIFSAFSRKVAEQFIGDAKKVVVQEVKKTVDDKAALYLGVAQLLLLGAMMLGGVKPSKPLRQLGASTITITTNNYYYNCPPPKI